MARLCMPTAYCGSSDKGEPMPHPRAVPSESLAVPVGVAPPPVTLTAHDSAEEDIHGLSDTLIDLSLTV